MLRRTACVFTVICLFASTVFSQQTRKERRILRNKIESLNDTVKDDYYKSNFFRYENYSYKKNIRSVRLHEQSFEMSEPVLKLNSGQKLELNFDDLNGDYKEYSYTLIHCDAEWKPSDIMPMEYIEGFMDDKISYYRYSIHTLQRYTHYSVSFPNDNMKLTKSGNYVLKVYLDNPSNVVLSRRFMVYDTKVAIEANVLRSSNRSTEQEIEFTLDHSGYDITQANQDVKVALMQNGKWDNVLTGLKPSFIKDKQLVYNLGRNNVFKAGNEYRHFDIKSIKYQSEMVRKINRDSALVQVYLVDDVKRSLKRYVSEVDINGKYVVRINEGKDNEVEADYVKVHFFLSSELIPDGNLYIFGALSDWNCRDDFRLNYSKLLSGYEGSVLLKQGYYNFEYGFLKDGQTAVDNTLLEGSFFETENDYAILVYYRAQGTFYEQLIGYRHINSMRY